MEQIDLGSGGESLITAGCSKIKEEAVRKDSNIDNLKLSLADSLNLHL